MDVAHSAALFLHILGAAALVGGWFATYRRPTVLQVQLWGAWVQLVTGVLLVGLIEMGEDGHVNNVKITVKLVVLVGALVAAILGRRKVKVGQEVSVGLAHAVGGLALLNIAIAVFW